jgi:hypothetical protein
MDNLLKCHSYPRFAPTALLSIANLRVDIGVIYRVAIHTAQIDYL